MELRISSQFAFDFKAINDNSLSQKIKDVLSAIKNAKDIQELSSFRKINGNDKAYKIGIGFYYIIGLITADHELTLLRLLHRDMLMKTIHTK